MPLFLVLLLLCLAIGLGSAFHFLLVALVIWAVLSFLGFAGGWRGRSTRSRRGF